MLLALWPGLRVSLLPLATILLLASSCNRKPADGDSVPAAGDDAVSSLNPTTAPGAADKSTDPSNGKEKEAPRPANGVYRCSRIVGGRIIELQQVGEIALAGVVVPESNQPGGSEAATQLQRAVGGREVEVEFCPKSVPTPQLPYRAIVVYRDATGTRRNLNQLLLLHGFGRLILEECHNDISAWKPYHDFAHQNQKGLWKTVWLNESPQPLAGSGPTGTTPQGGQTPAVGTATKTGQANPGPPQSMQPCPFGGAHVPGATRPDGRQQCARCGQFL